MNQYIDEEKPWSLFETGEDEHLREILAYQVSSLLSIAMLLEPFMPDTAAKIQATFAGGKLHPLKDTLFPKHETDKRTA